MLESSLAGPEGSTEGSTEAEMALLHTSVLNSLNSNSMARYLCMIWYENALPSCKKTPSCL